MLKKSWLVGIIFPSVVLISTGVGLIIYSQISTDQRQQDQNNKTDLSTMNFSFAPEVIHSEDINADEAIIIKHDVQIYIQTQMQQLNVLLGTDYSVDGLDDIVAGADLESFAVFINSLPDSAKIEKQGIVFFDPKQIIDTWKIIENPIAIESAFENSLPGLMATTIVNRITIGVNELMLFNGAMIETDFEIEGLDLIMDGATFDSYKDSVYVKALPGSNLLIGQFKVDFVLV